MTIRVPKAVLVAVGALVFVAGGIAIGVFVVSDDDSSGGGGAAAETAADDQPTTSPAEAQEVVALAEEMEGAMEQDDAASEEEFDVCDQLGAAQRCYNQAIVDTAQTAVSLEFKQLQEAVGAVCSEAIRRHTTPGLGNEPRKAADICLADAEE